MADTIKDYWRRINIFLKWDDIKANEFYSSPFESITDNRLFAYRTCIAIYLTVMIITDIVKSENHAIWFAYLTDWGQMMTWFHIVGVFYVSYDAYNGNKSTAPITDMTLQKMLQVTFQTGWTVEVIIVIVYWLTVYPDAANYDTHGIGLFENINRHGLCLTFMTIEVFISNMKFYDPFISVSLFIAWFYALFNGIYTAVHTYLYSILTWNSYKSIIVLVGLSLFLVALSKLGGYITRRRNECANGGVDEAGSVELDTVKTVEDEKVDEENDINDGDLPPLNIVM